MLKHGYLEIPHSESKKINGSLNIDYHVKRLILIAMGRFKTCKDQANALGISATTLINYKKRYNL